MNTQTIESSQGSQEIYKTIIQVKLHQIPSLRDLTTHDTKVRKAKEKGKLHEQATRL